MIWEKIRDHGNSLDFAKLENFASRCSIAMQRKIGFFLNQIGQDADKLYKAVKSRGGYSRFTVDSRLFNAKWRIYREVENILARLKFAEIR